MKATNNITSFIAYRFLLGALFFTAFSDMSVAQSQQLSFKQVDSISYQLTVSQSWNALTEFGQKAEDQGFDYYYLNYRVGVAFFYTGDYYKAEHYFKKAWNQNSLDVYLSDFLYWTYVYLGEELQAGNFQTFSPDSATRAQHLGFRSFYVESGIKVSADETIAGNLFYYGGGLNYKNGKRMNTQFAVSHLSQKGNIWGELSQTELYLGSTLALGSSWHAQVGFHPSFYESKIKYVIAKEPVQEHIDAARKGLNAHDITTTDTTRYDGTYSQSAYFITAGVSKRVSRLELNPFVSGYLVASNPKYSLITISTHHDISRNFDTIAQIPITVGDTVIKKKSIEAFDKKTNRVEYCIGTRFLWHLPGVSEKLQMETTFYLPFRDSSVGKLIVSPKISCTLSKGFALSLSYLYKNSEAISAYNGSVLYNNSDVLKRLLSLGAAIQFSKKVSLFFLYQNARINDSFSLLDYKQNSYLLNLTFSL